MTTSADGYEPRFDIDAEYGRQGELWVRDIRDGLAQDRVEVKRKRRIDDLFYVEYQCRRGGLWTPSGIRTTDSPVWVYVIADSGVGVVVSTDVLREVARRVYARIPRRRREETDGSHPTRGVLVSFRDLIGKAAA